MRSYSLTKHPPTPACKGSTSEVEKRGVRTYCRKSDVYSGHILKSIGHSSCVRVSFAHYNSIDEVKVFLRKFSDVLKDAH